MGFARVEYEHLVGIPKACIGIHLPEFLDARGVVCRSLPFGIDHIGDA